MSRRSLEIFTPHWEGTALDARPEPEPEAVGGSSMSLDGLTAVTGLPDGHAWAVGAASALLAGVPLLPLVLALG
jgi:hypothetical protein